MIFNKKRYLLIGIFFAAVSVASLIWLQKGDAPGKNYTYTIICALASVLFLKNALSKK